MRICRAVRATIALLLWLPVMLILLICLRGAERLRDIGRMWWELYEDW